MKIGLISYQVGHLKTKQIADCLLSQDIDVVIFAFPFYKKKKEPMPTSAKVFSNPDRPYQLLGKSWEDLYPHNKVQIIYVDSWSDEGLNFFPSDIDIYIHCIAKILSDKFIGQRIILNTHPGILPENRGVDSLKWSILKKLPIGVTLHRINASIDAGVILGKFYLTISLNDSLDDVFKKAYDAEILILKNFLKFLGNLHENLNVDEDFPVSHSRLTENDEKNLDNIYQKHKVYFIEASKDCYNKSSKFDFVIDSDEIKNSL